MGPDQPLSTPNTPPNDPFNTLQHANTENPGLQGSQFDELLLDPSAPSQGTSMCPEMLQMNWLSDPPNQSSMHHSLHGNVLRGNRPTAAL